MGVLGADFAPAIAGIAPQCHESCRAGTTAEHSNLAGSAGEASCVAYLCAVCGAEFRDLDGLRAHLHAVHLSPTARAAEARAPRAGDPDGPAIQLGAFLFRADRNLSMDPWSCGSPTASAHEAASSPDRPLHRWGRPMTPQEADRRAAILIETFGTEDALTLIREGFDVDMVGLDVEPQELWEIRVALARRLDVPPPQRATWGGRHAS